MCLAALRSAQKYNLDASKLTDVQEQELIMGLYNNPNKMPELYAYAKALEAIESGLLGGFYYKHFCLASNVIGTQAKGTMNKSVGALKKGYEVGVFQNLDVVRSELGKQMDHELVRYKGRIMDEIEANGESFKLLREQNGLPEPQQCPTRTPASGGCPFGFGNSSESSPPTTPQPPLPHHRTATPAGKPCSHFEGIRRKLYSNSRVPTFFSDACKEMNGGVINTISFLDHAWGKTPPQALVAAAKRQYALYDKGNTAWDVIFGDIIPESIGHVKRVLNVRGDSR